MSAEIRTLTASTRPSLLQRACDIWDYRELLVNLVRKELKVKYKNSALGFLWSLLNPILYLVVFGLVFQLFLPTGIPDFAIFFLAGLLPWNLFSSSLSAATGTFVNNSPLINKVRFPREILPLATVGAGLVHFTLQIVVLATALVVLRHAPSPRFLLLIPIAIMVLLVFLSAFSLLLSAVNVYLRDVQHLLELLLLLLFWMTPIVYPFMLVAERVGGMARLLLLNPMVSVVLVFQRAIYNRASVTGGSGSIVDTVLPPSGVWWYGRNLLLVGVASLALLVLAIHVFGRLEGDMAEAL